MQSDSVALAIHLLKGETNLGKSIDLRNACNNFAQNYFAFWFLMFYNTRSRN